MWLEFMAYDENGGLLEGVSGNIGDGEIEEQPPGDPRYDPNLLMFRDRIYGDQGQPVHMFWQAAPSNDHPRGFESSLLPVRTAQLDVGTHGVQKQYRVSGAGGPPARVTARLRIRPIGVDVLEDLVASGDLDPAIVAQVPTFSFGARLEWTPADASTNVVSASLDFDCSEYRCLLYPGSQYCH